MSSPAITSSLEMALSSPLTGSGWLAFALIGGLAGWFAGRTLQTGNLIVVDVVVGVCGALLSGVVLSWLVASTERGWLFTLVTATCGASVPVWLLWRRHSA